MADRYWVGGSGSWSSTAKWSATSGGAGGQTVPTAVDNVFFDANSGTASAVYGAVIDTLAATCLNLTITPVSTVGVTQITISGTLTIVGTLSSSGTSGNKRTWIRGTTYGIANNLSVATLGTLTDVDFRDIYVVGSAAPISGTRIGDLCGIRGITASTPKTVYWNLPAGGSWSSNAWATSSGGGVSTDNFPLAQDTAVIENTGMNTSATVTMNSLSMPYTGTVDMSGRTTAMTLTVSGPQTIYGDWKNGSGTTITGTGVFSFSGRNTQTITSAGKTFTNGLTIDTFGGTVQLADAFNTSSTIFVYNGTFDTKNYNVTGGAFSTSSFFVRSIILGSSTVLITSVGSTYNFSPATNLTFNAGTSTLSCGSTIGTLITDGGLTFYNISFTGTVATTHSISGGNVFNNITVTAPASTGISGLTFSGNQTINGTLTVAGASAVRRIFLRSNTLGTTRTLTVNSLSADDCDFLDIDIAGAAAGSSPVRAGDCGGNTGITFPAPKTVYWNLAGAQNWSATAWAPGSGGTPDINQFPLAQDTAVFDDTGAGTSISIQSFNIGTIDASARTTALTFSPLGGFSMYGNLTLSSAITMFSTAQAITFSGRGTTAITSSGVVIGRPVTIDCGTGTVQLADALTLGSTRLLTLTSGTFDAVTYNVTTGLVAVSGTAIKTLKMGSGTWTLAGTGSVWTLANVGTTFFKGTANIVLSDTSTTARTFGGGNFSLNKLTIGGATGTSTTTINDNNQFTELASTKTVAHTIALGATAQTFGAWTVTGTAGNVVTVTGTAAITIAGARVSGVDYLAMNGTILSNTSPGEFYSGANSTGTGANIIKTAAPAPVTRYWVGGTNTWDATTTTKWSASSGGAGGASVPTSADAVVFDTLSNATAYTVTCTATQLRCGSLNMAGPLSGNVTWAGSAPIAMHDNVTLAATGITRTYTGAITLSGSSTGKTFTTNGVALASTTTVNGVGCGWTLGSAATIGTLDVINGSFATASYSFSVGNIRSNFSHARSISLGSSVLTFSSFGSYPIDFGASENERANLTFSAGTSQINDPRLSPVFIGNNQTFYNYSFTSTQAGTVTLNGSNTFNNLSFTGMAAAGLKNVSLTANQTINGTLTLSAGTNATMRTFLQSDVIGTTRTLTCAAVAAPTDADFRDITIAGAAAPVSGTRLGDCKGNSGITFDAAKTVYWNLAGGGSWSSIGWATTGGGTPAVNNFPLAQDTAIFQSTGLDSGAIVTVNAAYNIGTINMSARTANTMTLTLSAAFSIYGNWINGTGTTISGTARTTFVGRGSQTITSAGKTFTQDFKLDNPGGEVSLQDAFVVSNGFNLNAGSYYLNNYNHTSTNANADGLNVRLISFGSGTWTVPNGGWSATPATNLTVTGTGTINLPSASAKTFVGAGLSYSGITLNQGGAGALTITGNNTFANITNTSGVATSILLGTTTQTVGTWDATGTVGKVLTVSGTSAASSATLIVTGTPSATLDYLTITGVRAYPLETKWYAGANSTNNGSLGWYFKSLIINITKRLYYGAIPIASLKFGSFPVTSVYFGSKKVL
jgi:hypothetical protein